MKSVPGPSASLLTLFFLLTLKTILSSSINSRGPARVHLSRSHEISKRFTCNEPQSRSYNLRDVVRAINTNPSESVNQPAYIVLKRCDSHTGCCNSPDKSCTPVDDAVYYEDWEIEIWSLETNKSRREWIRVEQHGSCACQITTFDDRHDINTRRPNITVLRT